MDDETRTHIFTLVTFLLPKQAGNQLPITPIFQPEVGDSNPDLNSDSVICKPLHHTPVINFADPLGFEPKLKISLGGLTVRYHRPLGHRSKF